VTYDERPIQIVDRKVQRLRNREISLVRVQWQHHGDEQQTWEREDYMKEYYLFLF
jgi:hypothetical protein